MISIEDIGSETCTCGRCRSDGPHDTTLQDDTTDQPDYINEHTTDMSLISLSVLNTLMEVPVDPYGVSVTYVHDIMNCNNEALVTVSTDGPANSLHSKTFVEFTLSAQQVRQLCSYLARISQDM